MRLRDFLAVERVVAPLEAESLADAAEALVERLVAAGVVADVDKLRQRIAEDRTEDVVAMSDRAFVLHYRTDAVTDLRVAVGVAAAPLSRDPADEETLRARVVLMIVAHPRQSARYLQLVRGFARSLSRAEAVEPLAGATPEQVVALPLFAETELAQQLVVRDLMTERPRTTGPDVPLREAAREMLRGRLGALPVVDDEGQLLGILSERELVRHLLTTQVLADPVGRPHAPHAPSAAPGRRTVRDVMTRQVLCVGPEQPIAEVASLMSNKDVERVPVVREGRLVGFLTRGDIVRKLLGT